jgi:hypothetical protein
MNLTKVRFSSVTCSRPADFHVLKIHSNRAKHFLWFYRSGSERERLTDQNDMWQ